MLSLDVQEFSIWCKLDTLYDIPQVGLQTSNSFGSESEFTAVLFSMTAPFLPYFCCTGHPLEFLHHPVLLHVRRY